VATAPHNQKKEEKKNPAFFNKKCLE